MLGFEVYVPLGFEVTVEFSIIYAVKLQTLESFQEVFWNVASSQSFEIEQINSDRVRGLSRIFYKQTPDPENSGFKFLLRMRKSIV